MKARSVPALRVTSYCSGVSCSRHSCSDFSTLVAIFLLSLSMKRVRLGYYVPVNRRRRIPIARCRLGRRGACPLRRQAATASAAGCRPGERRRARRRPGADDALPGQRRPRTVAASNPGGAGHPGPRRRPQVGRHPPLRRIQPRSLRPRVHLLDRAGRLPAAAARARTSPTAVAATRPRARSSRSGCTPAATGKTSSAPTRTSASASRSARSKAAAAPTSGPRSSAPPV